MEPNKLDHGRPDSSSLKESRGLFRILAGMVALLMWVGMGFLLHKIGLHGLADWGSLIFVGFFAVGMTAAAIWRR
jgi:hypothetical protein